MTLQTKEESDIAPSPGKLRPTQLITTHGPGSFVQTENDSVMIMAIDFWSHKDEYIKKHHMYLQKITKKDYFLMPNSKEQSYRTIACISFPTWGYCKYCSWLQPHKDAPSSNGGFFCKDHPSTPLLPARLVMVCKRGHVDDFPWEKWAHSNSHNPRSICDSPKIKWKGGRKSSSIANFLLVCECGAKNSLAKALDPNGIKLYDEEKNEFCPFYCTGELPWLNRHEDCRKILDSGKEDEKLTETPIGMIVRSTSLYYSKIIRGIIIPELSHPIVKYLQSQEFENFNKLSVFQKMTNEEKAEQILESKKDWKEIKKYTVKQIADFMEKLAMREGERYNIKTELDLKKIEYDDLINNANFDDDEVEKEIKIKNVDLDDKLKKYFKIVRRLDVLTAIEIQRYFTRLKPPGEALLEEQNFSKKTICNIEVAGESKSGRKYQKNNWLPCVIKKGEGIFFVFNEDFIKNCINDKVQKRLDSLIENHKKWEDQSGWPSGINVDSQYIFLHSLSHVLIKELALRSGYSEASISERIYSSKDMCGLLIYTTSSGDGSLGGLVRQAENRLFTIFEDAFDKVRICSRDPICINDDPKELRDRKLPLHLIQNGSACYGCMMLPETTCEYFNKLLDRKILVDEQFGVIKEILND